MSALVTTKRGGSGGSSGVAAGTPPIVVAFAQVHENYKNAVTSSIDLSASALFGDVMVIAAWRQSGAWNTPAGFTLLDADAGGGTLPKVFARNILVPGDAVAALAGANTDPNWGGAFGVLLRGTDISALHGDAVVQAAAGTVPLPGVTTTKSCRDMIFGFFSGNPDVPAIAVPSGYTTLDSYRYVYPANGGIYTAGLAAQVTAAAAAALPATGIVLPNTGAGIRVVAEYAPLPSYPNIDIAHGITVVTHGAVAATARPSAAAVVYWIGSVAPTNAQNQDLFFDTSA